MGKHIIIREIRCSYPKLYGSEVKDGDTFGPGITLILEKGIHDGVRAEIQAEMRAAVANTPALKKKPPVGDKLCLRRPEDDVLKYKEGNLMLKAGVPTGLPFVLHSDGHTKMTEADNLIYSGCYVNAKIEIWGQDNKYGKRVNAKLIAVQYVPKAAESFDGSYVSPEEAVKGFEAMGDDLPGDDLLGGDENTEEDSLLN